MKCHDTYSYRNYKEQNLMQNFVKHKYLEFKI